MFRIAQRVFAPVSAVALLFLGACGGSSTSPSPAPSGDATPGTNAALSTLEVRNQTARTILFLYVSPCTDDSWGVDQLGTGVIPAGNSFRLTAVQPGCYDLRADTDSRTFQQFGVTLTRGAVFNWAVTGAGSPLSGQIAAAEVRTGKVAPGAATLPK